MNTLQMHIGGKPMQSLSRRTFTAYSPASGAAIAEIPEGDREDARLAIDAANAGKVAMARMPTFERVKLCHRIADILERRKSELATILALEQGKPFQSEAMPEIEDAILAFRMAAEDIKRLETSVLPAADPRKRVITIRQPKGVYAIITPWNWPISISALYVAPCLAAGNAVVLVPAPTTSACVSMMAECIAEAALPEGAFNMVTGPGPVVGDEVVMNPGTDAVAFTGSSATGEQIARRASGKSLMLELGGNGPMIVLDDANISQSVTAAVSGCFLCAGQSCSAAGRILVHKNVHEEFLNGLMREVKAIRLGDSFDDRTTMGPLNNEDTAAKMDRHVADAIEKGARLLAGGSRASGFPTHLYYQPTIVDCVTPGMALFDEESFGPVAPITVFSDDDEALELASRSQLGLLSAVFTTNLNRAFYFAERLRTGVVNINESTNYWEIHTPFGGISGKRSGYGRVGGKYTLLEMTDLKTIVIDVGGDR